MTLAFTPSRCEVVRHGYPSNTIGFRVPFRLNHAIQSSVVANTSNLQRNGAVGFIHWLGIIAQCS